MASLGPEFVQIINQSSVIEDGTSTRYRLKPTTASHDQSEPYKKMTFGEKDKNKPHKTILMVGETGAGKTTLINAMINYMLGVKREGKVWFEITDEQSDRSSVHSQTSIITVYGFYPQESPIHLTIIDTPGYGDTRGADLDKQIAESLFSLCKSAEGIHEIDAVCLVIKSTQTRLSERQQYIFDAVQSLFGGDIPENSILLFTHSRGAIPKNVLKAVEEDKIKCAKNDKNQPVYFLFDNCQSEAAYEENTKMPEQSWNLSFRGMEEFFKFLDIIKPKSLKMTQNVLQKRKLLDAKISKIQSHIQNVDIKQNDLMEAQKNLDNTKLEYEVKKPYIERVDIDRSVAYEATCCTVCMENCHYPGCWWVRDLSWCTMMKENHCTVCTNKCHYSKHVKEAKIYVTNKENEKKYGDKISDTVSLVQKLEEELQGLKIEKIKLVMDAFHCVDSLEMIALNTDSLFILQHVDLLIEKLKEINDTEKVKTLENIKKRGEGKKTKR